MAAFEYDIKLRSDTAANWTSSNPTLLRGEIGYEYNTKLAKIGDGTTAWNSLEYGIITKALAGIAGGYVPLNVSGEIDAEYINQVAVALTTAFTPAGNLAATNVQAAIQELDSEKEPLISTGTTTEYIRGNKTLANFPNTVGDLYKSTGLVTGGVTTLNADVTKIDISACDYYILGVRYSYAGTTAYSPPFGVGETARRFGLSSAGLVSQQGNFSDAQKQTIIPLSRLQSQQGESGPGSTLIPPIDLRYILGEEGYLERIWKEQVFGSLYAETGGTYSENATLLRLDQAEGVFFDAQGKKHTAPTSTQISAKYVYHVSGAWSVQSESTLVVNTSQYDNGTDLTTLSDSYWVAHTLLRSPKDTDEFFIILGSSEHPTQTEAEAEQPNYGPFSNEDTSGLIAVAKLIVRKGSTSINRIVNIQPRIKGAVTQGSGISALLPTVSNPTELKNYEDAWRYYNSGTIAHGCAATDNTNGTFSIASGEVVIRSTDVDSSPLSVYAISSAGPFSPVDNAVTYYYIDYNNGAPVWASGASITSYNGMNKIQGFTVSRRGTSIWIIDARAQSVDGNRKIRRRDIEWSGNYDEGFWHTRGGTAISASGLSLILSSGKFYYGLAPVTHPGFNTTVVGTANVNVFDYYYNRASYTYVANSKTINNTQYDNAGTLTAMSPGRYRTDWAYILLDGGSPRFIVVMGNTQHTTLALAQAELVPTTRPAFMQGTSVLVGRIIANEGSTTLNVSTPFVSYVFQ